jgi:outer membrane receptor for ferrienterochelin and colicin
MQPVLYFLLCLPFWLFSQSQIKGTILEPDLPNQPKPLTGANVFWLNTSIGAITNGEGMFQLPYESSYDQLVVSYVGYKTDTLTVKTSDQLISHLMTSSDGLEGVTVSARKKTTATSYLSANNVMTISSKELLKAACCNLSESFETNPSIDVNFTDAISGAKQIKMLGLTSPYLMITNENIPEVRGASQVYGLSFIPGTWVESIQITKGAGSVVNGFESIAGQINAEMVKPTTDTPFFINAYGAVNGRLELNTHINTKISDKWSTGLYIHADQRAKKFDNNGDSFLDMPLTHQINIMNRWQYTNPQKGLVSFLNIRYLNDDKQSGQLDFDPKTSLITNFWGSEVATERFGLSSKLGYVNPLIPYQSLGLQLSYSRHDQESYFGRNVYAILHESLYSNLVYNSIISDSRHKIKTGLNFNYDNYRERVISSSYLRSENSLGGFFEYSFDNLDAINLTAGIRIDHHNLMGTFLTPRFHMRYTPWEKSAFRLSFGRGKRTANIFAENQKLFATSRQIKILNTSGKIYGLNPEIAWNYGISFLQGFQLLGRKSDIIFDFYRTDFQNQVVVDYENPFEVSFYNLQGRSYANSLQLEVSINLSDHFDLKSAYKFYDVKTQYKSGLKEMPLIPQQRVFFNISYETNSNMNYGFWKFDSTFNWLGRQRFSSTLMSSEEFRLPEFSPSISTLNAQITKVFSKRFEWYIGGENITNTKQQRLILSAENPFGSNFDTTFVYGPVFGSMYYTGLRFKLNSQ